MFSYLLDTEFLHTKAIIIIGVGFYLAITVVMKLCGMWTKSNGRSLWIMATTECYGLLLLLWYVYYGIVEFSIRDKQ